MRGREEAIEGCEGFYTLLFDIALPLRRRLDRAYQYIAEIVQLLAGKVGAPLVLNGETMTPQSTDSSFETNTAEIVQLLAGKAGAPIGLS